MEKRDAELLKVVPFTQWRVRCFKDETPVSNTENKLNNTEREGQTLLAIVFIW